MVEPAGARARRRVAVLISGRGSNLAALIAATTAPTASARIVLVLADRADAAGLGHAAAAGIPAQVVERRAAADRAAFEAELDRALAAAGIELVCLAGFMRILSAAFVERWRDRLLNIHPSLLPAFRGIDTHRCALAAGVRFTGCTVHFVRAEIDQGPIVVQAVVPVAPDDSEASLAARVLAAEHCCYPLALELVAAGRVRVVGERVEIDGIAAPAAGLISPLPA
jgi:phosphoribosylglycinamide formyltransferase-1